MKEAEVQIINRLGLHARAAAKFVSCTSAYSSKVRVGKDGNFVDGKSIMAVMMLAAGKGSVLDVEIEGQDEQDAMDALRELIENRFQEDE